MSSNSCSLRMHAGIISIPVRIFCIISAFMLCNGCSSYFVKIKTDPPFANIYAGGNRVGIGTVKLKYTITGGYFIADSVTLPEYSAHWICCGSADTMVTISRKDRRNKIVLRGSDSSDLPHPLRRRVISTLIRHRKER